MKLRHPALLRLLPSLAQGLLTGIFLTCRRTTWGQEHETRLLARGPIIYAVWHGHLPYILYYFRGRRGVVMASPSFDGEIVGGLAQRFGLQVVHGSRHKGGLTALTQMAALVRQGYHAGLAADGSRGPRHIAQKGLLVLSREAQIPILPLAVASSRRLTLNTWDSCEIPLPGGRLAMLFGEPLDVPPRTRGPRLESLRQDLQDRLNHLFALSRRFFA